MIRDMFLQRDSPSGDSWWGNMAKVDACNVGHRSLDKIMQGAGWYSSEADWPGGDQWQRDPSSVFALSSAFRTFAFQEPFFAKNDQDMEIVWHDYGSGGWEHDCCLMSWGVWRCGGFQESECFVHGDLKSECLAPSFHDSRMCEHEWGFVQKMKDGREVRLDEDKLPLLLSSHWAFPLFRSGRRRALCSTSGVMGLFVHLNPVA